MVQVIQETLRTASILSFTFREAIEDVEFEGYYIPKGWKVLPLFRSIHHSADFFPQPEKFDPSRFEVKDTAPCLLIPAILMSTHDSKKIVHDSYLCFLAVND